MTVHGETEIRAGVNFAEPDITDSDVKAVSRVMRTGWITTGDECRLLEEELARYLGVPNVVAVSSCTAAIEIAVAALDLAPGARVGVPTWTFVSTALAPYHRGARPVLLDVERETLNLSPRSLERALEAGLDAVVGVHFGGVPLSTEIHDLCQQAGVPLIEDAAHALGARDHRGMVAGQGTAGACFSFYATKNLTSGEGGALATDDPGLAAFAESYRLHGMSRDAWARYHPDSLGGYDVVMPGIKANLSDIQAALARSQLQRFAAIQEARRTIVGAYRGLLEPVEALELVPSARPGGSADHLMVVLLPEGLDRALVVDRLAGEGIGTSVHFQPLHTFAWFVDAGIEHGPGGVPVADDVAGRALSLPLHSRMDVADVERVCDVLIDAVRR